MKKNLTFLILLLAAVAHGQTIMNIYQSSGTVLQIPLSTIDSITYTVGMPGTLATISTLPAGNITAASATGGGSISSDGGTPVTQRGVCWSTAQTPTTANSRTTDGTGTGSFSSALTGLSANTTYYVRAYAINSAGTAYGNQVQFTTTSSGGGSIVSNPGPGVTYGGYTYPTIILGNGQEWMSENLRTTTYANGDPIPNVLLDAQWAALTSGAWCWYYNDAQYENPYGKLYNWFTVSDPRNLCPNGWHVPTDSEWTVLTNYLGGSIAGCMMKSTGTQYWQSPNTGATNQSGFSGLPGGWRSNMGTFDDIGSYGFWWSASLYSNTTAAWYRLLSYNNGVIYRYYGPQDHGFSVRCLRD